MQAPDGEPARSRPADCPTHSGSAEPAQPASRFVLAADHETLKGHVGYVCGPPMMVEAALKTLMLKRLFPRDIFKEEFLDASAAATVVRSPLIKR